MKHLRNIIRFFFTRIQCWFWQESWRACFSRIVSDPRLPMLVLSYNSAVKPCKDTLSGAPYKLVPLIPASSLPQLAAQFCARALECNAISSRPRDTIAPHLHLPVPALMQSPRPAMHHSAIRARTRGCPAIRKWSASITVIFSCVLPRARTFVFHVHLFTYIHWKTRVAVLF